MKISVSLPDADVAFLDSQGSNRSETLHKAVQLLRSRDLDDQYAAAFEEFAATGDQTLWDRATNDGQPA